MQLVAYRNTEAGVRKIKAKPAENPVILAMVRRKSELARELASMVREREAWERTLVRIRAETAKALDAANKARAQFERVAIKGPIRMETLMRRICRVFGISRAELISDSRQKRLVLARHAVCYWAVRRTTLSMPQIGRVLGGRDHTTVMHGRDSYVAKRRAQGRVLREVR